MIYGIFFRHEFHKEIITVRIGGSQGQIQILVLKDLHRNEGDLKLRRKAVIKHRYRRPIAVYGEGIREKRVRTVGVKRPYRKTGVIGLGAVGLFETIRQAYDLNAGNLAGFQQEKRVPVLFGVRLCR